MATKRGYYRAELLRAIDNIEMALTHITRIIEAYEKDHKDVSQMATQIGQMLVTVGELVQRLHDSI